MHVVTTLGNEQAAMADHVAPIDPSRCLAGQVAVVAGATRGAGRGVARALGEVGAIVYCTGRSTVGRPSPYNRPETIEETAEMIRAAGGSAIPLRVDHTVEAEVEALFERVNHEQGRLDILVNSIAGEDPMMTGGSPLWNVDLTNAEALIRQAVVSRLITAKHAARLMVLERRGLIVEVTENNLLLSSGDVITQLVRFSHKALATIYAADLRRHGVATVAMTPGFLRSERMLEYFGVTEDSWREAGKKDRNFLESESPLFVGRAIVALATDPSILERTGQLFSSWEVGREYGLSDIDGQRPDWGKLDIDYSQVPLSVIEAMMDGIQVQAAWLELLLDRTRSFQETFLKQTAAVRKVTTG
jgi:NAD(P)-dependent dehydrogenase (short-subunit alcohol dehydrogenase family)